MPGGRLRAAMKIQEVILRAMAKRITWRPAAEIIGISDRSLRRWLGHYEQSGYAGLFDRRPIDQARPVQLAALGGEPSDPTPVRDDTAADLGVAGAEPVAPRLRL